MLTQEQKDKLHRAIDQAQGRGRCRYVIGGEPGCVIGQLGAMEGADLHELRSWEGELVVDAGCNDYNRSGMRNRFFSYPPSLLYELQAEFDRDLSIATTSDQEMRQRMHLAVENFVNGVQGGA